MKDQALYDLLQMIPVEPGSFLMGSPEDEEGRGAYEEQTSANLSRPFELGKFPVTNTIWHLVVNKPIEGDPFLPKVNVSWFDAAEFCQKLNKQLGLPQAMIKTKKKWDVDLNSPGFRLPTEVEWEYACRAGTTEARYGPLDDIAWHSENSGDSIQPVGLKLPNHWGFYDMLGNVSEWCWNWHQSSLKKADLDPSGPNRGKLRVIRGGSWRSSAHRVRAGFRFSNDPGNRNDFRLGFRLARTLI